MPVWLPRHGRMRPGPGVGARAVDGNPGATLGRISWSLPASQLQSFPARTLQRLHSSLSQDRVSTVSLSGPHHPATLIGAYSLLLPRCLHGLKIKTTATPRVPAWALESISYHIAGPSLDSQLELGEQTTASSTGPGKSIERKCGWGQAPPTAPQFPGGPHPPAGWHSGWGSKDSDWKMKCE